MTLDMRSIRYPLESLHRREGWRLDTLRAELADATRRHDAQRARRDAIERAHEVAATDARPASTASIDPVATRHRLAYLGELRARLLSAAGVLQAIERERDRLRIDGRKQHARLESIDEHRTAFVRSEAIRVSARQAAESDRDWLTMRHRLGRTFSDNGGEPA